MSRTVEDRLDELEIRIEALEAEHERAVTADPTRSPEDVAETWYRAEDMGGQVIYYPVGNDTEVSHSSQDTPQFDGPLAVYGEGWDGFRYELGERRDPTREPWKAHGSVHTVDAANVPFSEVPADE